MKGEMGAKSGFLIVLLVLIGLILRVQESKKSFWLDELHTTELAHASPSEMVEMLKEDFHAPLFYLLVMPLDAIGLEGHGLRALPVLLNLLGAIPLLLLARRFSLSDHARLLLVAAYMLAPFQLRYGAELRPYSLLALSSLWMLWAALGDQRSSRCRFLVFCTSGIVALYTHYLAAVFIVAVGAARLLVRRDSFLSLGKLILSGTMAVALFLPWILIMESWLVNDPGAIYRADEPGAEEKKARGTQPGLKELSDDILNVIPRTFAPGADSLGRSSGLVVKGATLFLLIVSSLLFARLLLQRRGPPEFWGAVFVASFTFVLVSILCVEFWRRVPIQYFALLAWIWPIVLSVTWDAFGAGPLKNALLGLMLCALFAAAGAEVMGEPREDLKGAINFAADLALDDGAHLTAIMRQPKQYRNSELFRVYLKKGSFVEPQDIPQAGSRSVVVITRRLDLTRDEGPPALMKNIRAGRFLAEEHRIGRAVSVWVFKPQSNK